MMGDLPQTVTPRRIQREYRKVFDAVKSSQKPVIVLNNSKPDVVIIPYEKLNEYYRPEQYEDRERSGLVLRDLAAKAQPAKDKRVNSENFRYHYDQKQL